METKQFPLRVVLTVTTGKLLTTPKNGGNGHRIMAACVCGKLHDWPASKCMRLPSRGEIRRLTRGMGPSADDD